MLKIMQPLYSYFTVWQAIAYKQTYANITARVTNVVYFLLSIILLKIALPFKIGLEILWLPKLNYFMTSPIVAIFGQMTFED